MKFDQLLTNKKFLLIVAFTILIGIVVFFILSSKPTTNQSSGTYDNEGNFYSSTGDIYYSTDATEEPDVEPELNL